MNKGFSLVELSIVLVILGLLTGGILAGQSLIRAAELRSVPTQAATITTAIYTFKDKYFAIPGDMDNAIKFWGDNSTLCSDATVTDGDTCNGNGDGFVDTGSGASVEGEIFMFWNHLANASLMEGSYTGVAGALGNLDGVIGENVPRGKIGDSAFSIVYITSLQATYYPSTVDAHLLRFGTDPTTNNLPISSIFNAEEIWNIDTKLDDGRPGLGKVLTNGHTNCADSTTASSAEYALNETTTSCHFIQIMGF